MKSYISLIIYKNGNKKSPTLLQQNGGSSQNRKSAGRPSLQNLSRHRQKQYKTMVNSSEKQSWWGVFSTKGGLARRSQAIQKYRSPHTMADEILRLLRYMVQPLLIAYCMFISFASYEAFFGHNFSPTVATAGAALLCIVMEFGKIKIGSYVFQKPFLQGWGFFKSSFADFSVWGGSLLFMVFTFIMSVTNSTQGAHQLSLMKGTQQHAETFTTNTADIDSQIAATNSRIKAANGIKWKGVVTYQAQKAIERDTRNLESLSRQREAIMTGQRADFERRQQHNDKSTETGANILMASGGWVEALQLVTLFLIAACMSVVGGVMDEETKLNSIQVDTNRHRANGVAQNQSSTTPLFMFNRRSDGNVQAARSSEPVSQSPEPVTQQNTGADSDKVLQWCKTAVERDLPNFNEKWAKKDTVSARINKALDQCKESASKPGFSPSREEAVKFYSFLIDKAIPTLNGRGYPYPNDLQLLSRIKSVMPDFVEA